MKILLEQFSLGLFIWQTLIFLALLIVLKKYAWGSIIDAINKREEKIKNALEDSKIIHQQLNETNIKIDKMIKEANSKRDLILEETYALRDIIILNAKKQADNESYRIIKLAKEVIENEKKNTIVELKNYIGLISVNMLEKVLTKDLLNKKIQKELIKNLVKQLNLN